MMPAASRHAARLVFICAAVLTCARAIAGPYDPQLQFKTLLTPHFAIHFHQHEEDAARRLGMIAESVHARLATALGHTPAGRTEVVLVQQSDVSNGQTTVVPWNAIEIDTTPPGGAELLGNSDDWLAYVFTHEYAHVLHLDRSRGWARIARGLFGRSDWSFPNLTLPEWQIEGFATLVESHDGQGRLNAGDFREVVDAGVRAGRVEPIDRVSGGLVDWPAGDGWYAYGARFQEFLVERFGAAKLVALSDRTAGRLPFLTAGAFDAVYGQSLGDLWDEFERIASRAGRRLAAGPASDAHRISGRCAADRR